MFRARSGTAFGAVFLMTATLQAAESPPRPSADRSESQSVAQAGRERGFNGFPDWDSRSGGYDRSRRPDPRDADRKDDKADDRRGPGPGPDRGRGPAQDD